MSQTHNEWSRTAELARLELNEDEMFQLTQEAERMQELFLSMSRVDVSHLEPTTHVLAQNHPVRYDQVDSFENISSLVEASPEQEDDFFLIPNVL